MDLVRPADGGRTRLGQSQRPYLALLDESLHRAHRLLDRHLGIDAVLVIQIDHLNSEALQARLAGAHHVLGPAVDVLLSLRGLHLAELGGDDDAVAPAAQRSSEQLLVVPPAVHVGRVEEIDALVEGVMDRRDRLVVGLVAGIATLRTRYGARNRRALRKAYPPRAAATASAPCRPGPSRSAKRSKDTGSPPARRCGSRCALPGRPGRRRRAASRRGSPCPR